MHGITDDDDDDDAPQQLPFWSRMEGEEGGRKGVHTYVYTYVCIFAETVGYPRPGTDKCAPKSMHRVA